MVSSSMLSSPGNIFEPPAPLQTAVLFLVFNRPEVTAKVFEAIRQAKPPRLYVSADGARTNFPGEVEQCAEVRRITTAVDWPCEVITLFREKNLGCKLGVSSGISWFFENEEQGIILEDDCLPSISFFWYCEELLNKYKNNPVIMHIAGMTYVENIRPNRPYSYHFVKVGGIWGWASWRRAWKLYQSEMETYPQAIKENVFDDLFVCDSNIKKTYLEWFRNAYGNNHTWDYQWTYTKIINNSINIMPAINLVINIGHGVDGATHTTTSDNEYSRMRLGNLKSPLSHPHFIVIDTIFNRLNLHFVLGKNKKPLICRVSLKIIRWVQDHVVKIIR